LLHASSMGLKSEIRLACIHNWRTIH